jgi:hypothetical protein
MRGGRVDKDGFVAPLRGLGLGLRAGAATGELCSVETQRALRSQRIQSLAGVALAGREAWRMILRYARMTRVGEWLNSC